MPLPPRGPRIPTQFLPIMPVSQQKLPQIYISNSNTEFESESNLESEGSSFESSNVGGGADFYYIFAS